MKLQVDAVRRRQVEQQLSQEFAQQFHHLPRIAAMAPHAAASFVEQALQDGFSLGRGIRTVALLSSTYGAGFLRDLQYPQLAALFRADIRDDEAWRLSLLREWQGWQQSRGYRADADRILLRLRALAALLRHHGRGTVSQDPAALFHAIDPLRTALHEPRFWREVTQRWRAVFTGLYPTAAQFQIDYACTLAFCCGQYFPYDPLWQSLGDLNPDNLFSIVN